VLGSSGQKPLFVIGLNPSTADDKEADRTIKRVMGFAEGNGFDSFVMLNLYPQRATYPTDLDFQIDNSKLDENISEILKVVDCYSTSTILAAWGTSISIRGYFKTCIKQLFVSINHRNINWVKIGESTKEGHPRHPLYAPYALPLNEFDIENYLTQL
jgi:hypothetical protein